MASPTAVGTVGLGASAAGSLISAFGAKSTGDANAKMYSYQAGIAQLNSQIALQNADYARNKGEEEAVIEGRKGAQTLGQIKATQGASGLDVNSGSNKDVQESQIETTKLDLNQTRSNAAKTAYDYTVQSQQDISQAGLYDMASSNSRTAGNINAVASLVSGAGSVSTKWLAGNTAGLWKSGDGGSPPTSSYGAVY